MAPQFPPVPPTLYAGTYSSYAVCCLIVSHQDRAIENTSGKELRSRTPSVCPFLCPEYLHQAQVRRTLDRVLGTGSTVIIYSHALLRMNCNKQ
jgi:hypothetical protein